MSLKFCCFFVFLYLQYASANKDSHTIRKRHADVEEATMPTPQIIQKNGYPAELYSTTTDDGYVLEMHRIPYGVESPPCRRRKKPVALLMHDIISSSSDFIINGPNISLAYYLADNGFDVWMGNVRGNRYSRNHRSLNPGSTNFWDFTFHELGDKDLPAIIDYILDKTEQPKLYYIGHSMGSTIYYVLMSEHPEYNNKIVAAFHLSPVVYLSHMKSPILRLLSFFVAPLALILDIIGVGEFLPRWELMKQLGQFMCKGADFSQPICTHVLFILSGFNPHNLDLERFPIYMGHTPAGASTRTFMHYGQISVSGVFRKYDLGVMENLLKYQNLKAPEYNLKNNKVPIYLIYSPADWFAGADDLNYLFNQLPEGIPIKIEVTDPNFAHIDFLFGMNAREQVYDNMLMLMKKHQGPLFAPQPGPGYGPQPGPGYAPQPGFGYAPQPGPVYAPQPAPSQGVLGPVLSFVNPVFSTIRKSFFQ